MHTPCLERYFAKTFPATPRPVCKSVTTHIAGEWCRSGPEACAVGAGLTLLVIRPGGCPAIAGYASHDGPSGPVRARFQVDDAVGREATNTKAESAVSVACACVELVR